jgi:hypothetical protein
MIRKARRRESPTGEVDWLAVPLPDLVPMLRKNRNVMLDIADPLGNIGTVCSSTICTRLGTRQILGDLDHVGDRHVGLLQHADDVFPSKLGLARDVLGKITGLRKPGRASVDWVRLRWRR